MHRIPSRAASPSPQPARRRLAAPLPVLALLVLAWGCSGFAEHRRAQIAEQEGKWDEAVLHYMELLEREPEDLTYRAALLRAKMKASQVHFEAGRKFAEAESLERALFEYRQAVELDPTNQYAATERKRCSPTRNGRGCSCWPATTPAGLSASPPSSGPGRRWPPPASG